jgi:hypothetical protein
MSRKEQSTLPKIRVSKRFAWLPTRVSHNYGRPVWLQYYTAIEKWDVVGTIGTGISVFTRPIYGWVTIGKYKI